MNCCEDPMAMGRVVCPKPCRVGPCDLNSSVMPLRFRIRNDVEASDSIPGGELLDLILRKDYKAEQCTALPSSPPFFFGSPPCRAANPVTQDSDFGVETEPPNAFPHRIQLFRHQLISKSSLKKKKASIRVEGFDCQSFVLLWHETQYINVDKEFQRLRNLLNKLKKPNIENYVHIEE